MKRHFLNTMFALLICSFAVVNFTSCNKDQTPPTAGGVAVYEGVFNPQKRIVRITETEENAAQLVTEFAWNGDKLNTIIFKDCGTIADKYTYSFNEYKQVTSIMHENYTYNYEDRYDYHYNAEHQLESISVYDDDVCTIVATITKRTEAGKISRIDYTYPTSTKRLSEYYELYVWVNSNIFSITSFLMDDQLLSTRLFLSDDKKNPFYGLLIGTSISNFDPNNILSETETSDETTHSDSYTYTYDDDGYPVSASHVVDDERITCTYEYQN